MDGIDTVNCLKMVENFLSEYANLYFKENSTLKYKDDITIRIELEGVHPAYIPDICHYDVSELFINLIIHYDNPKCEGIGYIIPIFKSDIKTEININNTNLLMFIIPYLKCKICSDEYCVVDRLLGEYYV